MLNGIACQNIIYSSDCNPIELTDDVDLEFIKKQVRRRSVTQRGTALTNAPWNSQPSMSPTGVSSA